MTYICRTGRPRGAPPLFYIPSPSPFEGEGDRGGEVEEMYKENEHISKPVDESKIWRYMDFTKFVSLLDKSALFFTRADKLGDPFEGSIPKLFGEARPESKRDKESLPSPIFKNVSEYRIFLTKCTLVNCWHLNNSESAAMWKLYLKSNEGIAIQSTFNRLKTCLIDEDNEVYIGKIDYVDYNFGFIPSLDIHHFFYKRTCFEHEKELRVIIQTFRQNKNDSINYKKPPFKEGTYIKVDLDILVDKVYVAPTSPHWVYKLIKSTVTKYGLDKQVLQSSLEEIPTF
jgi:hypothetical protein